MRNVLLALILATLMPLFVYAQEATTTSSGATVTYSKSTQLTCPDNSTLSGSLCYCNQGYKVSGTECVKYDPTAGLGPNDIYQDIYVAVTLNSDIPSLTCQKMGFATSTDLDMCTRYKASPTSPWNPIPRPSSSNGPMITNPWAPASQQTMTGSSTPNALQPLTPPPPPPHPPPPPVATSTIDDTPLMKALSKAIAEGVDSTPAPEPLPPPPPPPPTAPEPPPQEVPSAITVPQDPPPPPPPPQMAFPQIASVGALPTGAAITPDSPGLSPFTNIGLAEDQKIDETPQEKNPGLFARIVGFLFGWL